MRIEMEEEIVPSSQPDSDDDALLNAALSGDGEEVIRLLLT